MNQREETSMVDVKYVTFDLYDTTVVRTTASEFHVYELVWDELSTLDAQFPNLEIYAKHRKESELASGSLDAPSLRQILEFMPEMYAPYFDLIESVESEVEMRELSVIPNAVEFIQGLRSENIRIAFISDMHISARYLQPKIELLGLYEAGDILLVSSDVGLSKARKGKLFRYFLDTNNLLAKNITHYGNSLWSDVRMARKHGLRAKHVPEFNRSRYESLTCRELSDGKAADQLNLTSKLTRTVSYRKDNVCVFSDQQDDRRVISDIACSVAGPVLYFFVLWVLEQCRQESIVTIRFLTRDGEIFKAITDELPSGLTDGLDIQLLEVSRNSLVLPTASVVPIEDWVQAGLQPGSFLVQHFDRLPAQHLFQRAGVCIHEDSKILSEFGLTEGNIPLGSDGLEKWKLALASPKVHEIIRRSSKSKLNSVVGYMQQNISNENISKVALVDVGWTGQQAAMLGALIQETVNVSSMHLLVGRLRNYPLLNSANIKGWLFDESNDRPSPIPNPVALFESFLATTSGGVDSYEMDNKGVWIARRRSQEHTQALKTWGQETVKRCIVEYAKNSSETTISPGDQLRLSENLLKEFWCNPTYEEGRCWGDFPYEQDQSGKNIAKLTKRYSTLSVLYKLLGKTQEVDWKAGSLAISAAPLRELIKIFDRLKAS